MPAINRPRGKNSPIIIDGKIERFERSITLDQFDFSPDGSRYAYIGSGQYGAPIYLDGSTVPVAATDFIFSPDGKHIAISGYGPTDNVHGLWVDGKRVYKGERNPDFMTFSSDNQHCYWQVVEPDPAKAGYWNHVTYVDGKPVARCDNVGNFTAVTMPAGYSRYTIHPGWQTVGDSGLACLGPVDDTIKRVMVTPSDSSVTTMVAGAAK